MLPGEYRTLVRGDDATALRDALRDALVIVTFNELIFDLPFVRQEFRTSRFHRFILISGSWQSELAIGWTEDPRGDAELQETFSGAARKGRSCASPNGINIAVATWMHSNFSSSTFHCDIGDGSSLIMW